MSRALARRAAVLALASAVAVPLVGSTPAAADPAVTAAENGLISYSLTSRSGEQTTIYVANPDGSGVRELESDAAMATGATWSADGSRYAYTRSDGVSVTKRADGGAEVVLGSGGGEEGWEGLAWSADGRSLVYTGEAGLAYVAADGGWARDVLFTPEPGEFISTPTVAPDNTVAFVFDRIDEPSGIYHFQLGDGVPALLVEDAWAPAYSPDGSQLTYTARNADDQLRIWIADADGGNAEEVPTDPHLPAGDAAWSPDGTHLLFSNPSDQLDASQLKTIELATGEETTLAPDLDGISDVSWQPVVDNDVVRIWGQDHLETAIATSQMQFGTGGADAVVLSRDDIYYDALVGSALAISQHAPLLVTRRTALDARVEREINRVLPGGGRVYLLGGELALTPAVANRLTTLGYTVERIWGQTHFDTAIAINNRITTNPEIAIVTTGTNFYDALAAGAAAGANPGAVIALTAGSQMPAATASYLNGLDPDPDIGTMIVTAGGPGDRALDNAYQGGQLPSWPAEITVWPLVGANEMDTAIQIAEFFFAAPTLAAVATNRTWFDALTGGALIGAFYGPLLITDPAGLYPGVRDYLSTNAGNMSIAAILGGTAALPNSMIDPLGDAISLPGRWNFTDIPASTAAATAALALAERAAEVDVVGGVPGAATEPETVTR